MRASEALELVRLLQLSAQKCRSNLLETLEATGASEEVSLRVGEGLHPWLFGDRCVLRATELVLARGSVEPGELYNLMWVADRDGTRELLGVWLALSGLPPFPGPDLAWHRGWDPE